VDDDNGRNDGHQHRRKNGHRRSHVAVCILLLPLRFLPSLGFIPAFRNQSLLPAGQYCALEPACHQTNQAAAHGQGQGQRRVAGRGRRQRLPAARQVATAFERQFWPRVRATACCYGFRTISSIGWPSR